MKIENGLWYTLTPNLSPKLTNKQYEEMKHIRPLIREPNTEYYRRLKDDDKIDPRNVSYIWNAEPDGDALCFSCLNKVNIITFHKYGAPSLFKPSIAEVYSSIRHFCKEFDKIHYFYLHSENLDYKNVIGDCHYCKCTLFGEVEFKEKR